MVPAWAGTRGLAAALHPQASAHKTSLALKKKKKKKKKTLQTGESASKEVCGFFSSVENRCWA